MFFKNIKIIINVIISSEQLKSIRKMTFSKLYCEGMNIQSIQKDAFDVISPR